MCDKFFESVGIPEDELFEGGGSLTVFHQIGEKVEARFLSHFLLAKFFHKYCRDEDNARVLLILNHHSKFHWTTVGSKLGTNVTTLEEKGALVVMDLMKEVYNELKSGVDCASSKNDILNLDKLYNRCEQTIQDFQKTGSKRVLVIVEDLTNLLEAECLFQDSERKVLEFVLKLRALSVKCLEETRCSLSLASLVQSPETPLDCVEQARFAKTVSLVLSSVLFEVSPLSTGFSAQVTGFIKVVYKPHNLVSNKKVEKAFIRHYHFKLDSNNARVTPL